MQILLIGDSGVGKSSLLQRFTTGHCNDQQPTTIGVDFGVKQITVYNSECGQQVQASTAL